MSLSYVRRPTSPVFFEPLRPEERDILCLGSDEEESLEGHRNKRQRVEEAAGQYLRGKTLYISSSRLYGPFNSGWSNPWANKSKVAGRIRQQSTRPLQEKPGQSEVLPRQISEIQRSPTPRGHTISRRKEKHSEYDPPFAAVTEPNHEQPGTQESFVTALSESTTDVQQFEKGRDIKEAKKWLKSSEAFLRRRPKERQKLPSPTPMPKRRVSPSLISKRQVPKPQETISPPKCDVGQHRPQPKLASPVSISLEKPVQVLRVTPSLEEPQRDSSTKPELNPSPSPVSSPTKNVKSSSSKTNVVEQAAKTKGKHVSKKSAKITGKDTINYNSENGLIETVASYRISCTSGSEPETRMNKTERSAHKLPPSTTLPEFEYRPLSKKGVQPSERKSFAEELKASKKKARAEVPKNRGKAAKWKLSFTASGSVKSRESHTFSAAGSGTPLASQSVTPPGKSRMGTQISAEIIPPHPGYQPEGGSTSQRLVDLPEAQLVPEELPPRLPSGPSTDLLETDKQSAKFPSTEEYMVSTQAALIQAQRSFQIDNTPLLERKQGLVPDRADVGISPAVLALKNNETPFQPDASVATPGANDEPISTQAMIDAMSPFPVTTVKRQRQMNETTNPALSTSASSRSASQDPNDCPSPDPAEFQTNSISMSTSPSPPPVPTMTDPPLPLSGLSKPSSTITSFSIAPNGTCTEFFQQDGQQRPGFVMGESEINDALKDMDSFLGGWNVEAEARNQGSSKDFDKASENQPG